MSGALVQESGKVRQCSHFIARKVSRRHFSCVDAAPEGDVRILAREQSEDRDA
jgi:hypothetical protein